MTAARAGSADAAGYARLLQRLEDRRQRVGFQEQLLAERADSLVALLRQGHHGDVLGVGQADCVQDRLVGAAKAKLAE